MGGVDPRNTSNTELLGTPTQTLFLHRRRLAGAGDFGFRLEGTEANGRKLWKNVATVLFGEETEKLTHLSRIQMSKTYSDDATKNLKVIVYGSFFFKDRNAKI